MFLHVLCVSQQVVKSSVHISYIQLCFWKKAGWLLFFGFKNILILTPCISLGKGGTNLNLILASLNPFFPPLKASII